MDSAVALISGADRQLEVTAQNVSNLATPGYRARQSFWALVNSGKVSGGAATGGAATGGADTAIRMTTDFSRGSIAVTSNPYDLAITGNGFFAVSSNGETRYTRNGQFLRANDGRIVTADGLALQSDAGDLVLHGTDITVLSDGTVLDNGEPVARILVTDFHDKAGLQAAAAGQFRSSGADGVDVFQPGIRQGAVETSNVSSAHEMVTMMMALRQAETGQHLVQFYDELLGQAITGFSGTTA